MPDPGLMIAMLSAVQEIWLRHPEWHLCELLFHVVGDCGDPYEMTTVADTWLLAEIQRQLGAGRGEPR